MISFLKQHAEEISKIVINLFEVKILPTDFGTGMKAIVPTVVMFDNKKYYIELVAEQKFPFYPNNKDNGFDDDEILEFLGIKICHIIDDSGISNPTMHGEVFPIDILLELITDKKLKTTLCNKTMELLDDAMLEDQHLTKINEMWLERATGSKTLARKYIYN